MSSYDDYPNDYELMQEQYAAKNEIDPDDYELMLEQDIPEDDFNFRISSTVHSNQQQSQDTNRLSQNNIEISPSLTVEGKNTINAKTDDAQNLDELLKDFLKPLKAGNINKRTFQDVFGDIDDILNEEQEKKRKVSKQTELELIEHITQLRNLHKKQLQFGNVGDSSIPLKNRLNSNYEVTSSIIPQWPHVAIVSSSGKKLYFRYHSSDFMQEEIENITCTNDFKTLMDKGFTSIWEEAQKIVGKMYVSHTDDHLENNNEEDFLDQNCLWVEQYKPRKYTELLSDENINRALLHWIQLWNSNNLLKVRKGKEPIAKKEINKYQNYQKKLEIKLDENGLPLHKIALLCGPPGLGKTTLAHLVARHAGYNVIEINASDDRSIDSFKNALENATQMKSIIDQERRPNCLILDEIDGAPVPTIDFLIKFISGNAQGTSKKPKQALKRPIICICNDLYAPALRNLRNIAFVIHFPPTAGARLSERLLEISRDQCIKTDVNTLLALCEKTQNDIRSCLSILQFYKTQKNCMVKLSDIHNVNIGQKDVQKGLFTVWQEIFQVQRINSNELIIEQKGCLDVIPSFERRMSNILRTVQCFGGEYERLALGVFENYPNINIRDYNNMENVCEALEWFINNDILNKSIYSEQNFNLLPYMPYSFVMWHFLFANLMRPKLTYPIVDFQAIKKFQETQLIIKDLLNNNQESSIAPALKIFLNPCNLILDIVSYLLDIICPQFNKSIVNIKLLSDADHKQLEQVVNVMIDYNLIYIQERVEETGTYRFILNPPLEKLVNFSVNNIAKEYEYFKTNKLSYSVKQLIARQVDLEKMRRIEQKIISSQINQVRCQEISATPMRTTQNHLMKLQPKALTKNEIVTKKVKRDFFGQIITESQQTSEGNDREEINNESDIWYHYKEGYNNAVRKSISIDYFL